MDPPKPLVIAVLDDEEQMRKALRRLLSSHGYQVETYASGARLMEDMTALRPDCVVLDLHMTGMSGFDILQAFDERREKLPVIVITGHDMPGTAERVRILGAVAYLLKPVDELTLVSAIQQQIPFNQ